MSNEFSLHFQIQNGLNRKTFLSFALILSIMAVTSFNHVTFRVIRKKKTESKLRALTKS